MVAITYAVLVLTQLTVHWAGLVGGEYAKLQGEWKVSSQEWYRGVLIAKKKLPAFRSLTFNDNKCRIVFSDQEDTKPKNSSFKVAICPTFDPYSLQLLDADGDVRFTLGYKLIDKNHIKLSICIIANCLSPIGFDVKTDRIILLLCDRAVKQK